MNGKPLAFLFIRRSDDDALRIVQQRNITRATNMTQVKLSFRPHINDG